MNTFFNVYYLNLQNFITFSITNKIIAIQYLFIFSNLILLIGLFSLIINRKNLILILLSLELIFLSISLNYIFLSVFTINPIGFFIALFLLAIAAAEIAVALSIIVLYYKIRNNLYLNTMDFLQG
jgi:NADH:ubiquinone oxidoreductase subunit K